MTDMALDPGQGDHDEIDFTFDDVDEGKADQGDFDFDLEYEGEEQALKPVEGEGVLKVSNVADSGANVGKIAAPHSQEAFIAPEDGDEGGVGNDEIDYEDQDEALTIHDANRSQVEHGLGEGQVDILDLAGEGNDEIDYQEDDHQDASAISGGPDDASGEDLAQSHGAGVFNGEAINASLGDDDFSVPDPIETGAAAAFQTTQNALGDTFEDGLDLELQDVSGTSHIGDDTGNNVFTHQVPDELNLGLAQFGDSTTASPPDVTVTWGDEVCPLCKTSDGDDPSSFYIEDLGVLNLPLSAFLASVRKNISSWVEQNDEIHIRVRELGLEFSETTTEALLNQVTFLQLVALHDRLAKNDDPAVSKGLNLILTTRPNCTLRLRELVNGAGGGKGLSSFQPKQSPEESSAVSDDDEMASDDLTPSDNVSEEAAENQHSIAAGTDGHEDMSYADDSAGDENAEDDIIDYEENEEGVGEHDAEEDLDVLSYSNDQGLMGDIQEEAGNKETAEAYGNQTDLTTQANTDVAIGGGFDDAVDDLLSFDDDDTGGGEGNGADLLGYSGGLGDSLNSNGQGNNDHQPGYFDEPQATNAEDATRPVGYQDNETGGQVDDEYLDLGGDADPDDLFELNDVVEQPLATEKVNLQPVQGSTSAQMAESQQTSATTTLNGDEIDYDDTALPISISGQIPENSNDGPTSVDEIDWDDEDKILAPNANSSTPTNLKRNREVDDIEELLDDGHDDKRQRPEDLS